MLNILLWILITSVVWCIVGGIIFLFIIYSCQFDYDHELICMLILLAPITIPVLLYDKALCKYENWKELQKYKSK